MNSLIEGSLTIGWLFTAFLVAYWTVKALAPTMAAIPLSIKHPRSEKTE